MKIRVLSTDQSLHYGKHVIKVSHDYGDVMMIDHNVVLLKVLEMRMEMKHFMIVGINIINANIKTQMLNMKSIF